VAENRQPIGGHLATPAATDERPPYTADIGKLPGKGAGIFEAAANSPSLTVCDLRTALRRCGLPRTGENRPSGPVTDAVAG
jgi:hypothetical protein